MTSLPEKTAKKLGLVIDLDTCVGCQACATSCKEWNTGGYSAPLTDRRPLRRRSARSLAQSRPRLRGRRGRPRAGQCTSRAPACTARRRLASPSARRGPRTSGRKTASCSSIRIRASAASCAPGPAPMARARYDYADGVMKKCTLCIDRIYNETLRARGPHSGLRASLPDRRTAFRRSR